MTPRQMREAAAQKAHEIGLRHTQHGYTAAKSRTGRDKANAASRCALEIEDAIRALPALPESGEEAAIPVALPFARLPQHAGDPGFGAIPLPSEVTELRQTPAIPESGDADGREGIDPERIRYLLKGASEAGCKLDGPAAATIIGLLDAHAALSKENFALAADQCHDGYGDERGNHRCKEIDARDAEIATLRAALEGAKSLLSKIVDMQPPAQRTGVWTEAAGCLAAIKQAEGKS